MEDTASNHESQLERSPEEIMTAGEALLADFRQVDGALREAETAEKRNGTPISEALEDQHDQFMGVMAELPSRDIELARYTYEALTDSDDPTDRYWAATFFSRMLPVDKRMGLSMLDRLIGREETEHAVMDRAWDELTTTVASENLLSFSEAIEYVGIYHSQLGARYSARAKYARGKKPDDHTKHDRFPPYSFPTPGDTPTEPSEHYGKFE